MVAPPRTPGLTHDMGHSLGIATLLVVGGLRDEAMAQTTPDMVASSPEAAAPAVSIEAAYTAELAANVSGGVRRGARYLDDLSIGLDADLERLVDWNGTTVRVSGLYNNGSSISELVGDAQAVSNIETGVRAARLYEAWIEHRTGPVSVKAGLYDFNSEFDVLDSASFFTSSAHGIGTDIGQSGSNGPSIFPTTALALRLAAEATPKVKLRAVAIDGVPGDPDRPARTVIRLAEGAFLAGEAELTAGTWRVLAGHWRYTGSFDSFAGTRGRGNAGWYLRGERTWALSGGRTVAGFVRLGLADDRFNMFDRFLSAGVVLEGPFKSRPQDVVGVSISGGLTGPGYRRSRAAEDSETVLEASYRLAINENLSIQPTTQFVVDPGAALDLDNALFLGLRARWSFAHVLRQ